MESRHGWLAKALAVRLPGLSLMRWLIGRRTPVPPATFDFDRLAKDLAGGLSRREALQRVGGGLVGGLLASLGLGQQAFGAPAPAARCRDLCRTRCGINPASGGAFSQCVTSCAQCLNHGSTVCACPSPGVAAVVCCPSGQNCCGDRCSPCPCDKTVCTGTKGTSCCGAGETCCDGGCCPSGQSCCGGQCSVCPCDRTLCIGSKGTSCCAAGDTCCDGVCVNAQTDVNNCGTCSHPCDTSSDEVCCGGACITCHYNACCGSQGFACCLAHLGETCCDGACCPAGQHCEDGVCKAGCQTDANCISSRPEVCIQGICCLPPGTPYYGGACNGVCYTCPYDACCGSQGFGCCLPQLGETCCDGACCPAGQHCENGTCKPGCLTDANCVSSRPEVCIQGICCLPPGTPYYGGACNGVCYTCPYDACCGTQGFGCCLPQLGETCCDGACCPAGQHCQSSICVAGCVDDTNCAGAQVCSGGICG